MEMMMKISLSHVLADHILVSLVIMVSIALFFKAG
jgi:hypothetical protein